MRTNLLITLFILVVAGSAITTNTFPTEGFLDALVLTAVSGVFAFQLWLRTRLLC